MSLERTREEFTRQAAPMAEALAFNAAPVTERIVQALGAPPLGRVLDLACGPGLVCAALLPHADEVVERGHGLGESLVGGSAQNPVHVRRRRVPPSPP